MMNFIMLTICITVAILLASGLSMFIMFKLMTNQKVIEWYFKWFVDYVQKFEKLNYEKMFNEEEEEL